MYAWLQDSGERDGLPRGGDGGLSCGDEKTPTSSAVSVSGAFKGRSLISLVLKVPVVRVVNACMLQRDVVVRFGIWTSGTTVQG